MVAAPSEDNRSRLEPSRLSPLNACGMLLCHLDGESYIIPLGAQLEPDDTTPT